MALKLLNPGFLPLGQYDLLDTDSTTVVGGEVGIFDDYTSGDYYAADASGGASSAPSVQLKLGARSESPLHGLLDEGSSGYGTLFGTVIGGTVGQGTGFLGGVVSASAKNVVVVGPNTNFGSGKATLWTQPGLYGVTLDAFSGSSVSGIALNDFLGAELSSAGSTRGKLKETATAGEKAALFVTAVSDSSLVSTTAGAAGASSTATEYYAVYLLGPQA